VKYKDRLSEAKESSYGDMDGISMIGGLGRRLEKIFCTFKFEVS
jgi:hypothetical protein